MYRSCASLPASEVVLLCRRVRAAMMLTQGLEALAHILFARPAVQCGRVLLEESHSLDTSCPDCAREKL